VVYALHPPETVGTVAFNIFTTNLYPPAKAEPAYTYKYVKALYPTILLSKGPATIELVVRSPILAYTGKVRVFSNGVKS